MNQELKDQVTSILIDYEAAPQAEATPEVLLNAVYDQLRSLAGSYLRGERSGHTLQPTALVHEAYLRLADQKRVSWRGRTHFFAVGARMMRRLLVDHARKKGSVKRGGAWHQVSLHDAAKPLFGSELDHTDMLALDDALSRLAAADARQAKVVELRFFAGLQVAEVASALGVSKRTVEGDWTHARAWLMRELDSGGRS